MGEAFHGVSVVKNLPASARDMSSIPDPRSHMLDSRKTHEPQLLSLCSGDQELQLLKPMSLCSGDQGLQLLEPMSLCSGDQELQLLKPMHPRACAPQEKPLQWKACLPRRRVAPTLLTKENPMSNEDQHSQIKKDVRVLWRKMKSEV